VRRNIVVPGCILCRRTQGRSAPMTVDLNNGLLLNDIAAIGGLMATHKD
jgi:hypothetical protein